MVAVAVNATPFTTPPVHAYVVAPPPVSVTVEPAQTVLAVVEAVTTGAILFNKTDTLVAPTLVTAKSFFPSALKSLLVTEKGPVPTGKFTGAAKLPAPSPSKMDTLLVL